MESEQGVNVDAQSIVDAVRDNDVIIADDLALRIENALTSVGEGGGDVLMLDAAQYEEIINMMRVSNTMGVFGCIASMMVCGAVVASLVVMGWRHA